MVAICIHSNSSNNYWLPLLSLEEAQSPTHRAENWLKGKKSNISLAFDAQTK